MKTSNLVLLAALAVSACSSGNSTTLDGSAPGPRADATATGADAGVPDMGMPDTGPAPCARDQQCASGEVCNVLTKLCVPGVACMGDNDCERCAALNNPIDCKHGYHLNSYCGTTRGNVCTRALAPCEECSTDVDCGDLHTSVQAITEPQKCVDYANGKKYCARDATAVGCPYGFQRDPADGLCRRIEGCPDQVTICPPKPMGAMCTGTDQTCFRQECTGVPGTPTPLCATNDLPGGLGICIGSCDSNADCIDPSFPVCNQRNGLCISGCTKDSCAGGKVCHVDGFCADPCMDDMACTMKDPNTYCNRRGRNTEPRQFKDYRDVNSCAPLGCEQPVDCPAAGIVCDKTQVPAACVTGCYTRDDCTPGEVCKSPGAGGPRPSYNRAECRALMAKTDDAQLGVCCNPGCTDRVLQCDIMEFCCAEENSPYEDPSSCGTKVDPNTMMPRRAEAGECFKMAPKPFSPFCQVCGGMNDPPCSSDDYNGMGANWTYGHNEEPPGSMPFREQEFCFQVADGLGMCGVSCNPEAVDSGCPRGWQCDANEPPCFQDADCNGLNCDGENTAVNPPTPGRCQCGEDGVVTAACPMAYAQLGEAVLLPRCGARPIPAIGKMYCVASYMCIPPPVREMPAMSGMYNYPASCLP